MTRYTAIHLYETANGGVRISATGLPPSHCASYADLSPSQKLAAQLMVHAQRLTDASTTADTPNEAADEEADWQVA